MLRFDHSGAAPFLAPHEIPFLEPQVNAAAALLDSRTGPGNDFLGWLDLPVQYDREEFSRIEAAAERICEQSQVLVVIGIGGSYLGAKAALEFCGHAFHNQMGRRVEVYFAGTNLSGPYLSQLLEVIGDRDFSVNVISKSGTTTEP
ncbi:MAG TPA: glucose-6-phosphate isomerase, partial [Saprospiraceae bacterium]|nr:glucose-6-phosphate isomerase [Saprospiraceae bacterium]